MLSFFSFIMPMQDQPRKKQIMIAIKIPIGTIVDGLSLLVVAIGLSTAVKITPL